MIAPNGIRGKCLVEAKIGRLSGVRTPDQNQPKPFNGRLEKSKRTIKTWNRAWERGCDGINSKSTRLSEGPQTCNRSKIISLHLISTTSPSANSLVDTSHFSGLRFHSYSPRLCVCVFYSWFAFPSPVHFRSTQPPSLSLYPLGRKGFMTATRLTTF